MRLSWPLACISAARPSRFRPPVHSLSLRRPSCRTAPPHPPDASECPSDPALRQRCSFRPRVDLFPPASAIGVPCIFTPFLPPPHPHSPPLARSYHRRTPSSSASDLAAVAPRVSRPPASAQAFRCPPPGCLPDDRADAALLPRLAPSQPPSVCLFCRDTTMLTAALPRATLSPEQPFARPIRKLSSSSPCPSVFLPRLVRSSRSFSPPVCPSPPAALGSFPGTFSFSHHLSRSVCSHSIK